MHSSIHKDVTDKAAQILLDVTDKAAPPLLAVTDKAAPPLLDVTDKAAPPLLDVCQQNRCTADNPQEMKIHSIIYLQSLQDVSA